MTGQVVPKDKSREKEVDFQEGLERFLREAISLQKLTWPNSHPNIIQIKHFFNANNTAYFVMPFVDGKPLDDVAREKFWSEFELATMLSEILSGLTYVHQAGLIHRDIKPVSYTHLDVYKRQIFNSSGNSVVPLFLLSSTASLMSHNTSIMLFAHGCCQFSTIPTSSRN